MYYLRIYTDLVFIPDTADSAQGTRTVAIAVGVIVPLVLVITIALTILIVVIATRKYRKPSRGSGNTLRDQKHNSTIELAPPRPLPLTYDMF